MTWQDINCSACGHSSNNARMRSVIFELLVVFLFQGLASFAHNKTNILILSFNVDRCVTRLLTSAKRCKNFSKLTSKRRRMLAKPYVENNNNKNKEVVFVVCFSRFLLFTNREFMWCGNFHDINLSFASSSSFSSFSSSSLLLERVEEQVPRAAEEPEDIQEPIGQFPGP